MTDNAFGPKMFKHNNTKTKSKHMFLSDVEFEPGTSDTAVGHRGKLFLLFYAMHGSINEKVKLSANSCSAKSFFAHI